MSNGITKESIMEADPELRDKMLIDIQVETWKAVRVIAEKIDVVDKRSAVNRGIIVAIPTLVSIVGLILYLT